MQTSIATKERESTSGSDKKI